MRRQRDGEKSQRSLVLVYSRVECLLLNPICSRVWFSSSVFSSLAVGLVFQWVIYRCLVTDISVWSSWYCSYFPSWRLSPCFVLPRRVYSGWLLLVFWRLRHRSHPVSPRPSCNSCICSPLSSASTLYVHLSIEFSRYTLLCVYSFSAALLDPDILKSTPPPPLHVYKFILSMLLGLGLCCTLRGGVLGLTIHAVMCGWEGADDAGWTKLPTFDTEPVSRHLQLAVRHSNHSATAPHTNLKGSQ